MSKVITHSPIMTKGSKRFGTVYPPSESDYNATITNPGKADATITIQKVTGHHAPTTPVTFAVGDTVEYDSYNLSYTGTIEKIGPKTVSIRKYKTSTKLIRMNLDTFAWRNFDLDLAKIAEKNAETMMYI